MTIDSGKRTPLHKLSGRHLAVLLANAGYSYSLIADATSNWTGTSITKQQVAVDIAQVVKDAAPISPDDPLEIKRLQLRRLEFISNLALGAFIDSGAVDTVTDTETEMPTQDDDAEGKAKPPQVRKTRTRSRKRSAGDAKYLAVMAQVEEQRNRILGAHAPERREERGELTVTFSWADSPPADQNAITDSVEGRYRLADTDAVDGTDSDTDTPGL